MSQCEFIRKGYVIENKIIYNSYHCLKNKNHELEHKFYHEELELPIFRKLSDAHLFKKQMTKLQKGNPDLSDGDAK